ncbi:MAG: hypothetical protein KDA89_19445, partial [Planctomycetaceae bacterium]|nr:hypothetical protein [Planctomycetaceae bacterium]
MIPLRHDGRFRMAVFVVPAVVAFSFGAVSLAAEEPSPETVEFFERRVRPLLVEHCYQCHSEQAKTVHGGLRLDSADSLTRGGDSGPVVTPSEPMQSLLTETLRYDGDIRMPPKGRLPDAAVEVFTKWILDGAYFPKSAGGSSTSQKVDPEAGRNFWSFLPLEQHDPPSVSHTQWPVQRMD